MVSNNPNTTPPARKQRPMWPLYLIVLVCFAPVVFALLAYYVPSLGLRPQEMTNYGTLVEPQRPMPEASALPLTTRDGKPFDLSSLKGQWLLVTADGGACDEACVKKLFILRNSHASQGKNVERLARVWFLTDDEPIPEQILEAYRGYNMLRADPEQLAAFLAPKAGPAERQAALTAPMWVIDPLGNLMMEFPADADPISVRDDIRKLLKASRIG